MAPTRRPSDGLLARVNFPLYAIDMLTSRHILVAGGGGSAKTGVANGFEIYELYHNGSHFCAEEVLRHETGDNVVMNFAVTNDERRGYLCAGQESHCQMYHVLTRVESPVESDADGGKTKKPAPAARPHENGVRRRGATSSAEPAAHSGVEDLPNGHGLIYDTKNLKRIRFDIRAVDSIQTDFLTAEPLQRVVRISGSLMATGGTDGRLRLWAFPKLNPLYVYEAHTKEIDDIDFSPDNKYVVSIAKDGLGCVWQTQQAKLAHKLSWPTPDDAKYLYKRCRYGSVEGSRQNYRLYTLANPLGKVGRQRGYLQQWDCATGKLRLAVGIDESLASLAVRDDGRFVAVGTMFSGSVSMYIGFSLQRVLHIPNAHSMFVTGLQFLPILDAGGPPISSDTEAAVLSISVDNKVCIHSLQQRRSMPIWVAILLLISAIFGVFCICSYLGF